MAFPEAIKRTAERRRNVYRSGTGASEAMWSVETVRMGTLQRDGVNADRNVCRVCLASCGPVRESVRRINERRRQSGRTAFLPDFPLLFQPSLNNQSLFAEIGIGSAWNAAEASVPEKISEFCRGWGVFLEGQEPVCVYILVLFHVW